MSEPVKIQPDLDFIKELQEVGGDTLKKCYQCATCSVVCPLSPIDKPYPRKEMVWAQWGLRDKLINDIDIWLCHNCGQCSDLCPRGAKPGDLLAGLRNMAYRKLVEPTILGKWMSSAKYLPQLIGIPAIIYLIIWIIRAGMLGTAFPLNAEGKVEYGVLFPGDYTIDTIFGIAALFVIYTFYKGIRKLITSFQEQPKTFVIGFEPKGIWASLWDTIKDEIVTHRKWKDCGADTAADEQKFKGHLLTFYAFVALFIVTSIVAVTHWGGKVIPILAPIGHTPMPLWHPVKILANVGAIGLLVGLTYLTKRRLNQDPNTHASTFYDWYLLGVIWVVTVTGVLCELLRLANVAGLAYPMYYLHLISVFMLIAYLPWSKLGHLVYRTAALTYARHIGRLPMASKSQKKKLFVI
ncbi:MAG: quinone-interacting membrane-bound oxidoreductase complex subunit QmoC [Thermodesulfobacteriota bacterium]